MYWFNTAPSPTIISFGSASLYWYGLIMVLAMLAGASLSWRLIKPPHRRINDFLDLIFNLIIAGLISARLYHVFIHWPDYVSQPINILKVWEGGLAIHGGLIGGLLALWWTCQRRHWPFWSWAAWLAPGLALGQAIGRWGNFFNQELFGPASLAPWAIPIDLWHRPLSNLTANHFQPLFFYESLACLALAGLLYYFHRHSLAPHKIVGVYVIGYGLIRFIIEFFRQDPTPHLFGWRWPQYLSLFLIILGLSLICGINQKAKACQKANSVLN